MNAHDGDAPVPGDAFDTTRRDDETPSDEVLEMLSGYLDRGETPPAELMQSSPENQLALAALQRVREAAELLVDVDADGGGAPEGWVEGILGNLTREVRAGRSIPLSHPSPRASLSLTEGAVRGLVRSVGDQIDGVLVGRCVLDGDVTVPGSPITVKIEASVFWGEPIPESAERLRAAIAGALLQHTELSVVAVDVTVTDVHLRREPGLPGDTPVTGKGE